MKSKRLLGLGLIGVMATAVFAGDKHVAVYTVGKVDPSIQERVVKLVGEQLMAVTNIGMISRSDKVALPTIRDLGKSKVQGKTVAVLILAECVEGMADRHVHAEGKVVVVDVGGLGEGQKAGVGASSPRPSPLKGEGVSETLIRRVEKESMGGLAFVLGMEPCVLPTCVLFPTPAIEDIDIKGRGLCPPCMGKLESLMGER